ncbi:hypothetical protein NEUTE1DRAFT_114998 [Neurospora tetrasperma FGSC 2508]|uniref:Uncharacterized protein n=1 Tax=Neurospora tetrasperma (strain FGSC 2508 / ATCC MYA-4615 / P0657) TaxID=510951 RepID=F8N1G4_NEUT8|nr:uncharacterized protein NEUTE1DRAFT_114998 [Neurospora tetrasperma FGSC 2508]EGO53144.1 hypothetical protein NEUTE1DRAFT_114998 [Neurospora tetrasperma FGSC 2508]
MAGGSKTSKRTSTYSSAAFYEVDGGGQIVGSSLLGRGRIRKGKRSAGLMPAEGWAGGWAGTGWAGTGWAGALLGDEFKISEIFILEYRSQKPQYYGKRSGDVGVHLCSLQKRHF